MTRIWGVDPQRVPAGTDRVELKVVVPEQGCRALGIDPRRGPARRVYFLDTADLALYRLGVIVRFRDRPGRRADAVVKLRPVVPRTVPGWLRREDSFAVEIDAMPGHAVCSGSLKNRLGRHDVARAVAAGRPLTRLLSPRQRRLLATYAPGVDLSDLRIYGPIKARCQNLRVRGLDLTAERWTFPDGSDLVELSTRCPVDQAQAIAARVSAALRAYGVVAADEQRLKTEVALSAYRRPASSARVSQPSFWKTCVRWVSTVRRVT